MNTELLNINYMKLNPKNGLDELLFGMLPKDVINLLGSPNREFEDDDANKILLFNDKKLRLTFYEDEGFKLGYIIASNNNLTFLGKTIINSDVLDFKNHLIEKGIKQWEVDFFDATENHFNESNWLTLQAEFGKIIRVEIGAVFNVNDEMQFKFK